MSWKIDNVASTGGGSGNDVKYVGFPWPPVVAELDRKTLTRALHTGRSVSA